MIQHFNTFDELREAVRNGKTVFWASDLYKVEMTKNGGFIVRCSWNGSAVGLHEPTAKLERFYTRSAD